MQEKAMTTHSSILAWKIPWMEEPGRLQSMGSLRSDTTEHLHFHFSLSCIGEGKGNPLQCSCLENPRDSGAWGAAIYGVAQSRTRLKRLSSSSSSIISKYVTCTCQCLPSKPLESIAVWALTVTQHPAQCSIVSILLVAMWWWTKHFILIRRRVMYLAFVQFLKDC